MVDPDAIADIISSSQNPSRHGKTRFFRDGPLLLLLLMMMMMMSVMMVCDVLRMKKSDNISPATTSRISSLD